MYSRQNRFSCVVARLNIGIRNVAFVIKGKRKENHDSILFTCNAVATIRYKRTHTHTRTNAHESTERRKQVQV